MDRNHECDYMNKQHAKRVTKITSEDKIEGDWQIAGARRCMGKTNTSAR